MVCISRQNAEDTANMYSLYALLAFGAAKTNESSFGKNEYDEARGKRKLVTF